MFYSQFILAKKGPLGTIWIAAHLERKLRKNQVADTDIGVSVDSILFPEVPIALRLSSHLLLGVVRIYSRKVNYLFHDCSEALLKIKQAFRSTNVDLPPEESTAPYHSITLPDTFHLDDFELPDSAFLGDYDHHVSSKEQITLQDNLDKTGFSTSKFGLDERFGDGNASHVGLDLDEELFMHKDETNEHVSIRFVTNEFEQGESSENRTNMEIDEPNTNQKESNWSGGGYNIPTPGYNILTPAYNIQTPDLNEIFFAHDNNDGNNMDGPSNPTTPYAVDPDPPSPGFIECAPPSTPGLMEETGLARVNDASPSTNNDDNNNINNNGKININNEVAFLVPCKEGVKEVEKEIENGSEMQIEENTSNLVNVNLEDKNIIKNDNDNMQHENNNYGVVNFEDNNVNNMEVENISGAVNFEDVNIINNNNMEVENNSGAVNLEDITINNNNNNMEVENNSGAVNLEDNNNAMQIENDNNNSFDVVNSKDMNECTTPLVLETISEIEQTPEQAVYSKDISTNNFTNEPSTNNQFTSEPEKMLHAPSINNEFGQITTEKTVLESDGSVDRTTSNLIGQKRHLEEERESLLNFEKGSTERVSSRQRVRKINSDFINPDDDFLASILGSSRTPGLRLGTTPNKASSSKRQKVGPTPKSAVKRKVQMDESMVLHADVIRQQLINTEDIKRLRKKAPCTRAEIWIIKKGPLEDEIFNESLFSGCIEELTDLQHQVYEIDISKPLKQLIRENKGKGSFHEIQTLGLQNPKEIQTLDLQNPNEIQTLDSQNPIEIQTLDTENPKPNEDETLEIDSPKPIENENLDVENHNLTETLEIQNQSIEIQNQTLEIENPNEVETLDVQTPMAFTSEAQVDSNPNNLLLSEFNEENCITDQQQFENNNTEENLVDLSKNEENLLEGSGLVNLDETKDEFDNNDNNIRNSEIDNLFEDPKEDQNPNLENLNEIQEGFSFGIEGENSGFVGVESFGNDFVPKENSDFCSAIEGVDTDFLNVDDEVDFHEEANDDEANPGDLQSLDNSGWSSRTRGVGRYLKLLFDEETGHGRKSVAIDQLLGGKTRKEASRMFFETLVLTTKDYIHVKQESPFGLVNVRPGLKLMQSEF